LTLPQAADYRSAPKLQDLSPKGKNCKKSKKSGKNQQKTQPEFVRKMGCKGGGNLV